MRNETTDPPTLPVAQTDCPLEICLPAWSVSNPKAECRRGTPGAVYTITQLLEALIQGQTLPLRNYSAAKSPPTAGCGRLSTGAGDAAADHQTFHRCPLTRSPCTSSCSRSEVSSGAEGDMGSLSGAFADTSHRRSPSHAAVLVPRGAIADRPLPPTATTCSPRRTDGSPTAQWESVPGCSSTKSLHKRPQDVYGVVVVEGM